MTLTASRCFRPFSVFALCSHIFNSILLSHSLSGFYLGYRQPRSQDPGFSPTRSVGRVGENPGSWERGWGIDKDIDWYRWFSQ